jgi:hypothetical protein
MASSLVSLLGAVVEGYLGRSQSSRTMKNTFPPTYVNYDHQDPGFRIWAGLETSLSVHRPMPHTTWPGAFSLWGLYVSSLNEHRHRSPLLYWGTHISWCVVSVWWYIVWEISGVKINWDCWSACKITLLLNYFQPSLIQRLVASVHWLGANNCI